MPAISRVRAARFPGWSGESFEPAAPRRGTVVEDFPFRSWEVRTEGETGAMQSLNPTPSNPVRVEHECFIPATKRMIRESLLAELERELERDRNL